MAKSNHQAIAKMAAMREKFLSNLDGRLDEMEQTLEGIAVKADAEKNLHSLEILLGQAHKLRGAAGIFDLPDITDIAGQIEKSCKTILASAQPLGSTDRNRLLALYVSLKSVSVDGSSNTFIDAVSWDNLVTANEKKGTDSKRVIIVDDDLSFVEILQTQLAHFGFDVEHYLDYHGLREVISKRPPAALIMDVAFPGDIDAGVTVIKELRQEGVISCPVVFLSVRGDFQARLSAVRAGCDGYQTKPVDIIELVNLMERLTHNVVEDAYRVVIVDDDQEVAEFHAAILEKAGIETATVCNPLEVMGPVRELSPDVILMDISMPECSGFELAKVIRQDRSFVQIPIVFLSGSEIEEAWVQSMQSGADEYLRKDIGPRELVASVLARARRSRDLNVMINRLSESELRFRAVTESAREAIVTVDENSRIIYWNKGAMDTFGYDNAEILGQPVSILIPDRLQTSHQHGFANIVSGKKNIMEQTTLETVGVSQDGSEIPIEISLAEWKIRDKTYITGIIRDISLRRATEEDRDRLLSAVERSSEGMILFDNQDRFVYANQKYKDLYPSEIPELVPGNAFRNLIRCFAYENADGSSDEEKEEWIRIRCASHLSPGQINEQKTATGQWVRIYEFRTDEGGIFGVHTDITDLKQAREEAEKANRSKSEFLSSMSHELRTPLTSSIGSLGLLNSVMSSGLSEQGKDLLEIALRNNESLLRLVNELLDYEKILSGTLTIETRPHDLCKLTSNTLSDFSGYARSQSIELVFNEPQDALFAEVQEHRFEQVLNNLLSNAAKFSDAGSVVEIFIKSDSGIISVGVKDDGPGIPLEFRESIYEQFTQADSSSARKFSGTGLGLAISKALTEGMAGNLSFETEIGVGSTFYINFPELVS